jgi:hypothetical protein
MFNIFGKKKKEEPKKEEVKKEDLMQHTNRIGDRVFEAKTRLEKVELELRTAMADMRNARTPQEKARQKKKATDALRRKKMYTAQLQNLESTANTVENVTIQCDMVKDNVDIVK